MFDCLLYCRKYREYVKPVPIDLVPIDVSSSTWRDTVFQVHMYKGVGGSLC